MSSASIQVRWLVTGLMAVALPMCCCSGWLLSQAIDSMAGGSSCVISPGQFVDSNAGSESTQGCCSTDDGESPPDRDDRGPCDCPQTNQLKDAPQGASTVDVPTSGSLVVLVEVPATDLAFRLVPSRRMSVAATRPPTTLLRLHCALTV